jgi:hypothetical protein
VTAARHEYHDHMIAHGKIVYTITQLHDDACGFMP